MASTWCISCNSFVIQGIFGLIIIITCIMINFHLHLFSFAGSEWGSRSTHVAHYTIDQGGENNLIITLKHVCSGIPVFHHCLKFEFRTWKNSKLYELWCELAAEWTTLMSRSDTMRNMRILLCQHKPIIKNIHPFNTPLFHVLLPLTVNFQAAGEMGIAVCNVPGYGVEEVYKKYQKKTILKIIKKNGIEKLSFIS